ncbi:antiterminator Q family protein [Escherichia coli]|uniref:antiterminator Q family protein n=1 Tax=Escherichia coli TaxID=562 RepID=UPI003C2C1510
MSPSSGDALLCFVKRTVPAGSKGTNWYRQDYTQHKVVVPGASRCLAKVAHQAGGYLYGISKRKLAKVRKKDEKLIRIEIQMAEGFIDGCLSMLEISLEMDPEIKD